MQRQVLPRQARAAAEVAPSAHPKETRVAQPTEPQSLASLLDLCASYMPAAQLDLIRSAYAVAAAAHGQTRRKSGELFIEHPIAVATILAELAVDAPGIAAALLHDTVEDTDLTLGDVSARFGTSIAQIVDGVTKFTAFEGTDKAARLEGATRPVDDGKDLVAARERKARQHVETIQKLILAMARDPRVVLLKLADRLHNLRTMAAVAPATREHKSRETLDTYAPLAGRIGLQVFKAEMEDLAFSYLHPEEFTHTVQRLRDEEMKRAAWAERVSEQMRRELAAKGIVAAVNWRLKHPYRSYVEARETGMDVALLHDVIAFRVLVDAPEECYQAMGVIHQLWHPYAERIRDYIASPKVNGYQSLHTAVFALDGRLAQMHIRTHRMHRAAQHGVASFWLERAERGEYEEFGPEVWLRQMPAWISRLTNWQTELKLSAAEFVDTIRGEMFEDQVFVFTPKGDVHELPVGSTVLDLAYKIHTQIGDHAVSAVVQTSGTDDGMIASVVPLTYQLRTGDIVRVVTDPDASPQPNWLNFVETQYARHRISRALRLKERQSERGSGRLDEPTAETEPERILPLAHPTGKQAVVQLGRCCYPVPGDAIRGVADRGRGITIHRECCRTMEKTLAKRQSCGARYAEPLRVGWSEIEPRPYRLHLAIYGQDHQGLMHEVSDAVAQLGLNVSKSVARANQDRYKAAITLTLDMPPSVRRDNVLRRLRTVPGVTHVERDTSKGCNERDD